MESAINHFSFENAEINGIKIIHPFLVYDKRGFFMKTYERNIFESQGIILNNSEDMMSCSSYGVLRGLHFQTRNSQNKIIRVASGKAYYVAVDIRKDSKTFGKWQGFILSDENKIGLYIPKGFAHGLLTLSDKLIFTYRCGELYEPEYDTGICWNDNKLNIKWPISQKDIVISEKDSMLGTFDEFCEKVGGL